MEQPQQINDGLQNVVANLGTPRDKASHTTYVDIHYSEGDLLAMYRNSWLAGAIVDYPAEDATRKWRTWQGDAEQAAKIQKIENKLYLKKVIKDALISARLYGGSAIYINTPNADQSSELKPGDEIRSLVSLGRNQLTAGPINRDIDSTYYGWPEYFTLQSKGTQVEIHVSRFVLFGGSKIPSGSQSVDGGHAFWGDSVLQRTVDAVKQSDTTMANIASLVFEAKVDVFKFREFASMLADSKNDAQLVRRLTLQAAMKGINGAVVIDAEDDYEQKSATFAGLDALITKFQENVAGAAQMPVTRLFGRSSAGLSGSGDGDERVYYDRIDSDQEDIGQAMDLLDKCIMIQATGRDDFEYIWNPLRQLTQSERADNFSKTANAARALAGPNADAIIPIDALSDSVVNELVEQGMLPGLAQAIEKYGTLAQQEGYDDSDY